MTSSVFCLNDCFLVVWVFVSSEARLCCCLKPELEGPSQLLSSIQELLSFWFKASSLLFKALMQNRSFACSFCGCVCLRLLVSSSPVPNSPPALFCLSFVLIDVELVSLPLPSPLVPLLPELLRASVPAPEHSQRTFSHQPPSLCRPLDLHTLNCCMDANRAVRRLTDGPLQMPRHLHFC